MNRMILLASVGAFALAGCAVQSASGGAPAAAGGATSAAEAAIDARASRLVDAMTLAEQVQLLRTLDTFAVANGGKEELIPAAMRRPKPPGAIGSAGFIPGIPRLGIPDLQITDAGLGISNQGGALRRGDEATALPSTLALASTFDVELARAFGSVIGAEAHAKGFNVQLAGGLNLARDPRGGRNFEYAGEDPLLAGRIVGASVAGIQGHSVVSTVKHFALNDQESGRAVLDVKISEAAARESDLLAFQIAIEEGRPGAVMCAYNRIRGDHACESDYLLNKVLKGDWQYRGWVMSDWSAVKTMGAALAGLDQQSPQEPSFFDKLPAAVASGEVPRERVRDMAFRVVRSLVAVGALDKPARRGGAVDVAAHAALAQRVAEEGAVLLKNDGLLPLGGSVKKLLLVGGHADKWVVLGGGSAQVNPYGGIQYEAPLKSMMDLFMPAYVPSSPMAALKALRPDLEILYDDGSDPARAAAAARRADAAIIFATSVQTEGGDRENISLPGKQDELIAAVAGAGRPSAVVLETGNPVAMPWLGKVGSVLQAWYPGQRGGEAIAALLTGKAAPSGRLPITYPVSEAQLPRPRLPGWAPIRTMLDTEVEPFTLDYDTEGSDVGYRWFERRGAAPLFAFGHGLTYTSFRYSDLAATGGKSLSASFSITNSGEREGVEVAQLYVAPPGRTHRLAGWARVKLAPGEKRRVTISADPRILGIWGASGWTRAAGTWSVRAAPSAAPGGLAAAVQLEGR